MVFMITMNNLTYSKEQIFNMFNGYNIVLNHEGDFSNYYRIYLDTTTYKEEKYDIFKILDNNNIGENKYMFYTNIFFDENEKKVINRDNIPKIEIYDESLNYELCGKYPRFIPWENI